MLERASFPHASHDEKALVEILETLPRDSLLQMDEEDLFEIAIGLLGLGERLRSGCSCGAIRSTGSSPAW